MRVLIVDDERRLARALRQVLISNNYSVDLAFDGEDGLFQALTGVHDIIVLDIMLPRLDGLSVLRQLRDAQVSTPVLLLTARGATADKVAGLDAGADDYLAKPFHASELLARLRALSRRRAELKPSDKLVYGLTELDLATRQLNTPTASCLLTVKESQLMGLLMDNPGRAVPSLTLIERIWGFAAEVDNGLLQVHVSYLRRKLAQVESEAVIKTVFGIGYRLTSKEVGDGQEAP